MRGGALRAVVAAMILLLIFVIPAGMVLADEGHGHEGLEQAPAGMGDKGAMGQMDGMNDTNNMGEKDGSMPHGMPESSDETDHGNENGGGGPAPTCLEDSRETAEAGLQDAESAEHQHEAGESGHQDAESGEDQQEAAEAGYQDAESGEHQHAEAPGGHELKETGHEGHQPEAGPGESGAEEPASGGHGAHEHAQVPEPYSGLENPFCGDQGAISAGAELYATYCATCHGATGQVAEAAARALDPRPAMFADADMMAEASDQYLFWMLSEGSEEGAMPAWKDLLSDTERWQLVNFLRSLPREDGSGSGLAIRILSPGDGEEVDGEVTVRLALSGGQVAAASGGPVVVSPAGIHYHLRLDGRPETIVVHGDSYTLADLAPGRHRLEALVVNSDHSPFGKGVADSVEFTVRGGGRKTLLWLAVAVLGVGSALLFAATRRSLRLGGE